MARVQAFFEGFEFGVGGGFAHLTGLFRHVFEGGNFGAKLIQFHCGRKLVDQHVPFGIVKVIFILLIVDERP